MSASVEGDDDLTMLRDRFPVVELRPFVLYRPPGPQAMRRPSPRDAHADARQFIQRCTRLATAERVIQLSIERERPPRCERCSDAGLARLVGAATDLFGEPPISPERVRMDRSCYAWGLDTDRVGDVLDFLDDPTTALCDHVRVNGSQVWMFFLRDPASGRVFPHQARKFRPGWPIVSMLTVALQSRSEADIFLVFPFEPNETLRHYVVAVEAEAPFRFDPAYFDHHVPRQCCRTFERRRLPSDWLTAGNLGESVGPSRACAKHASVEGENRPYVAAPGSHPLDGVISEIGTALRTHRYRAVIVTGPWMAGLERIIERAAGPFGLRVIRIQCGFTREQSIESAIAGALVELAGERGVIVLEALADADASTRHVCETLLLERTVGAITLPQEVRLAATMHVRPNPALRASVALFERARWEGFLPDDVLRAAWSDLCRRLCSEVSVSFEERQNG